MNEIRQIKINTMDNVNLVKSFWDKQPCNIKHSKKEIGSKDFFDEVEQKKLYVEPHIIDFTEFKNWKNKKVLEIGCGIGTAAINFVRNGANYTGIELSEKSINLTKKRFEVYNKKGDFYIGNAENLKEFLPAQKFDLIYSFGVIHHSPNPGKIVDSLKYYMHEKSEARIMLYSKDSWKNYMIEIDLDQPEAQRGCPIANTYSKLEIQELFSDFTITSLEKAHIFPYKIEQYKQGIYEKEDWFKNMPDKMFNHLEKKLGWHTLIKLKLK